MPRVGKLPQKHGLIPAAPAIAVIHPCRCHKNVIRIFSARIRRDIHNSPYAMFFTNKRGIEQYKNLIIYYNRLILNDFYLWIKFGQFNTKAEKIGV
jgi:hypothetical protein